MLPAIEIIGTPFAPWAQAGGPNLASDNAAFGYWIMGDPIPDWSDIDLLDGAVNLSINGEVWLRAKAATSMVEHSERLRGLPICLPGRDGPSRPAITSRRDQLRPRAPRNPDSMFLPISARWGGLNFVSQMNCESLIWVDFVAKVG